MSISDAKKNIMKIDDGLQKRCKNLERKYGALWKYTIKERRVLPSVDFTF